MPRAPGPSVLQLLKLLWEGRGQQPFHLFTNLNRRYGPIVRIGRGRLQVLFVSDPEAVRQVLVVEADRYNKDRALEATRSVLGEGLLTSEGEFHRRQRRLIQPNFHRARLPDYAKMMQQCARRCSENWRDGQHLDLSHAMMALTLDVVASTLFGAKVGEDVAHIGEALDYCMSQLTPPRLAFVPLLHSLPLPSTLRFREHTGHLKGIIDRMIAQRKRNPAGHNDLLALLLQEEMSDSQLRDECLTLFLAGHETTANALTWTFYLLDQHPEIARRMRAEIDEVTQDETVSYEHLPRLILTEKIVRESMRLFPPAWTLGRWAMQATTLGGYEVPKGSTVVTSQWVMHRNPAFYPEPERFRPERWSPQFTAQLPRFAYYPFGGGSRICVAESFARAETLLLLATLAREWEFTRDHARPVIPQASITLRPRDGLYGWLKRREV